MSNISAQAQQAQEDARRDNGQFGTQVHTEPAVSVPNSDEQIMAQARTELAACLVNFPEDVRESALARLTSKTDLPELVHTSDDLGDSSADAYLSGDSDTLFDLHDAFLDDTSFDEREYLRDLLGEDWEDDVSDEDDEDLRSWVRNFNRSDPVEQMAQRTQKLMQIPPMADEKFEDALDDAAIEQDDDTRFDMAREAFGGLLTRAGLEMNEHNTQAIDELLTESGAFDDYFSNDAWKARLLVYSDVAPLGTSDFSEKREHDVEVVDPELLFRDGFNGRGYSVKLQGTWKTRVSRDNPARVDAQLGYGSWDYVAGVAHSAFRTEVRTS